MSLIKGKQLLSNSLKANLLYTTGATATDGQIAVYDSSNGGFLWVDTDSFGVHSLIGGVATSVSNTGSTYQTDVLVDNQSIFVDGSNNLTLGDPSTGLISGGDYTFADNVVINGNFTVLGTETIINTEELYVEDNLITLNSTFTAGTPTLNAGFEVLRGDEPSVEMRWNEANNWWEVTNPDGTATAYNPLLTTASLSSNTNALTVTAGVGSNADVLFFDIDESQLSNIPNSALTNNTINISLGEGLTGDTSVELGGTLDIGVNSDYDTYVTGASFNLVSNEIDFFGRGDKWDDFSVSFSALVANLSADTFVNAGSISYSNEEGTLDLTRNDGQTVTINGVNNTFTTGATINPTTGLVTFNRNDGDSYNITISGADFNDTYATGVTTNDGQIVISGNDGFTTFTGGTVVETVTGNSPITASTVDGAVTVGVDYTSFEYGVQTVDDKELVVASDTSGDNAQTGLNITNTPLNGGYVSVKVNGVEYLVGNGVKTKDAYFSADGGTTARAFGSIVATDELIWNGNIVGFNLETTDRVALFYEVRQ